MNSEDAKEVFGSKEAVGDGGESSSLGFLITSIYPSNGGLGGGYVVYINGSKFTSDTTFALGGTPCLSTQILSSTSATCLAPPSGSSGLVSVSASKVGDSYSQAGGFRYVGATVITSVSPAITPGTIPTRIVLTGTNFISGSLVNISHPNLPNSPCTSVNVVNSTTLECFTPVLTPNQTDTMSTSGVIPSIEVITPDGGTSSLLNALTLTPAPIITGISFGGSGVTALPVDGVLNNGVSNFTLTLVGKHLKAGLSVRLAGNTAGSCTFFNATQVRCTSLPSVTTAGGFNFNITNNDGQSSSFNTSFVDKPVVSDFSPARTAFTGGDVTINGVGLSILSAPSVVIHRQSDSSLLANCTVSSSSPLVCTAPDLGSEVDVFFRITTEYGYRADSGIYFFSGSTELGINGDFNLERVTLGSTLEKSFILTNPSLGVDITSLNLDFSALGGAYSFVSSTCTANLNAGQVCNFVVRFMPTALEYYESGNINISYFDGLTNVASSYKLNGWGIELEVGPPVIDFSSVSVGPNLQGIAPKFLKGVVINNRSNASVQVDISRPSDFSNSTDFHYMGGSGFPGIWPTTPAEACPVSGEIPPNTYCVAAVEFEPQSLGGSTSTFSLSYNSIYTTKPIELVGNGNGLTTTVCDPSGVPYGAGDGTSINPWQLCSEAHMVRMRTRINDTDTVEANDFFLQMSDITFTSSFPESIEMTGGLFDGGGYKLIDFEISNTGLGAASLLSDNIDGYTSPYSCNTTRMQLLNLKITAGIVAGLSSCRSSSVGNSTLQGALVGSSRVGGVIHQVVGAAPSNTQYIGTIKSSSSGGGIYYGFNNSTDTTQNNLFIGSADVVGGFGGITIGGRISTINSYVYADIVAALASGISANQYGVQDSHFFGSINVSGDFEGVGAARYGSIGVVRSSSRGTVSGGGGLYSGGVSGNLSSAVGVEQSYSTLKIDCPLGCGGLSGRHLSTSVGLQDSFFAGKMSSVMSGISSDNSSLTLAPVERIYVASSDMLSILSDSDDDDANMITRDPEGFDFKDVFYLRDSSAGNYVSTGVTELNNAEMMNITRFRDIGGWDFKDTAEDGDPAVWKMGTAGYKYPILDWMEDDWMP